MLVNFTRFDNGLKTTNVIVVFWVDQESGERTHVLEFLITGETFLVVDVIKGIRG